jgi:phenylacetate-coenzyme A ligase PaaK-like adenylate-forming protein
VFSSSGASGLRGVFVYSLPDWQLAVASILRCLARAGVPSGTRTIGIGAADPVHKSRKALAVLEQAGAEAPPVSARTPLPELVATLNRYQPAGLFGYPSIAAALAREQLAGRLHITPRWLAFGSEPLTAAMRDVVERAWGVDPTEYYASTELPVIAASTPEHPRALDVFEDLAVVEVVDERNRPVPAATPGAKLLVTNLEQRTLPLIRYELTDRVTLASGPNPAGRPWAVIAAIDGRTADTLNFPARSGRGRVALSPFQLAAPFAQLAGVRQYQLVHHDEELEIRLALDPAAPADTARRVEDAVAHVIAGAGATAPPIRITPVAELEREPGAAAKLKLVVNRRER